MAGFLNRIQIKLGFLTIALVVGSVGGSTLVAVRYFAKDKKLYAMDVSTLSAMQSATLLSREISFLRSQLEVADQVLQKALKDGSGQSVLLLSKVLGQVEYVDQLSVYQRGELIAELGGSARVEPTKEAGVRFYLSQDHRASLQIPVGERQYIVGIKPTLFERIFESSMTFGSSVLLSDGSVLFGSKPRWLIESVQWIGENLLHTTRQKVVTKENSAATVALAAVQGVENATISIETPKSEVNLLVMRVLQESLPFLGALLLIALTTGILFSRRLAHPLEELTRATSRIAKGEWKLRLRQRSRDEVGRLVQAFNVMGDRLEQRESELKVVTQRLIHSEKLATLGQFSAGLAHEVKNPLNAILGFAQLLEMKASPKLDDPSQKKYITNIQDETRRASKIISDLLIFARQKPPIFKKASVRAVTERAVELSVESARKSGVSLVKNTDATDYQVSMDSDQILQVFLNFIQNAIHAVESRAGTDQKQVEILVRFDATDLTRVGIEFKDNGVGIPDANKAKIFEPFFSTKGIAKGTGLGLTLCQSIVAQHMGSIEVHSEEGVGTSFVVSLPIAR